METVVMNKETNENLCRGGSAPLVKMYWVNKRINEVRLQVTIKAMAHQRSEFGSCFRGFEWPVVGV